MVGALMFKVKERRTGGEQRNTVKTEFTGLWRKRGKRVGGGTGWTVSNSIINTYKSVAKKTFFFKPSHLILSR